MIDASDAGDPGPALGVSGYTHIRLTGTLMLDDSLVGQSVYFSLPNAEGAVLTIGGQTLINHPSIAGDADLSGTVDFNDFAAFQNNMNHPGGWTQGDFDGNGTVNYNDFLLLQNNMYHSATPGELDSGAGQGWNPNGYSFQLDFYTFDGQGSPEVKWGFSPTRMPYGLQDLNYLSTNAMPKVTAKDINAFSGQPTGNVVANFTPMTAGTTAADYTAQIYWQDDTTENASIAANADGTFSVNTARTFPSAGNFQGAVAVADAASGTFTGSAIMTAHVATPALHPTITGDSSVNEGDTYVLNLDGGADPGESVSSFSIDWGDGRTDRISGENDQATHVYQTAGSRTIQTIASDGTTSYASANQVVTVNYVPPDVAASGDSTWFRNAPYYLSLNSLAVGTDDKVTGWTVNWGDGTTDSWSTSTISANHTYFPAPPPLAPPNTINGLPQDYNFVIQATAQTARGDILADPLALSLPNRAPEDGGDIPPVGGGNYRDADGDILKVDPASLSTPAHGTVEVDDSGSYLYTPQPGYQGLDSFSYRDTDGSLDGRSVFVVRDDADASVMGGAEYSFTGIQGSEISGVDPSTRPGTTLLTAPQHGAFQYLGGGQFHYWPDPQFSGADSFQLIYHDSSGPDWIWKDVIRVLAANPTLSTTVQLVGPNDPPALVHFDSEGGGDTPQLFMSWGKWPTTPDTGAKITLTLQSGGDVSIRDASNQVVLVGGTSKTWTIGSDVIPTLFVHGDSLSQSADDAQVSLSYTPPPPADAPPGASPAAGAAISGPASSVKFSVVSAQAAVDGNHDGTVNFDGSDTTTSAQPYQFWVNDNVDHYDPNDPDNNNGTDFDELNPKVNLHDGFRNQITNERDVEDWTDVRIKAPLGFDPKKSLVTAVMSTAATEDKRTQIAFVPLLGKTELDYQTNADRDSNLKGRQIIAQLSQEAIGTSARIDVPNDWYKDDAGVWTLDLLAEGVVDGKCAVTFSFVNNPGNAAVTTKPIYFQFLPTSSMYETWQVAGAATTNTVPDPKAMSFSSNPSLVGTSPYDSGTIQPKTGDYVLFVHGWRMLPWEKTYYANTSFKRLFWQGYKGKFGTFDWPTEWVDTSGTIPDAAWDPQNYDRSEEKAYSSAAALETLLQNLDSKQQGYQHVDVFAHSMGNVVASEALRLAGSTKVVHTYVASQAATVAGAYDANAPKVLFGEGNLPPGASDQRQPDAYGSFPNADGTTSAYFGAINQAADSIFNFYNPDDYATNSGKFTAGPLAGDFKTWRFNQGTKPDDDPVTISGVKQNVFSKGIGWFVGKDAGSFGLAAQQLDVSIPWERYMVFSYGAQAQTLAAGAQGGLHGSLMGEVDLRTIIPAVVAPGNNKKLDAPSDHGAEFQNTNANRSGYWATLKNKFGV